MQMCLFVAMQLHILAIIDVLDTFEKASTPFRVEMRVS